MLLQINEMSDRISSIAAEHKKELEDNQEEINSFKEQSERQNMEIAEFKTQVAELKVDLDDEKKVTFIKQLRRTEYFDDSVSNLLFFIFPTSKLKNKYKATLASRVFISRTRWKNRFFFNYLDMKSALIVCLFLFHQNLQMLQDLENERKEQIEELESTRSNLDEIQNKLTEVRVIRHIIY